MIEQFWGKLKHIYYSHKSGSDPPIWPPINHLHISPDITNCANQVEESINSRTK